MLDPPQNRLLPVSVMFRERRSKGTAIKVEKEVSLEELAFSLVLGGCVLRMRLTPSNVFNP